MERRALGSSGLHISVIGLGTMTFGGTDEKFGAIGQTDVREAERLIDIAIEQGVNFFDTSDNYARWATSARILYWAPKSLAARAQVQMISVFHAPISSLRVKPVFTGWGQTILISIRCIITTA